MSTPTPQQAREILARFNASHFHTEGREHARYSIPADPKRDDDLRLAAFINQADRNAKAAERLRVLLRVQQESAQRWARLFKAANRATQKKQARIATLDADRSKLRAALHRLSKAEEATRDAFEGDQITELEAAIEAAKQAVDASHFLTV